jgi:hypothetical protein
VSRLGKVASSALVIAVVAAVLAFLFGQIGQRVAREWQQEDKRLEIRTSLVRRVAKTNAEFLGTVRLYGVGAADVAALDEAYRAWAVESSSLAGELGAYVDDSSDVPERWRNLRTGVGFVYSLLRAEPRLRAHWLEEISKFTAPENTAGQVTLLNGLLKNPPPSSRPAPVYDRSLRELLREYEQKSDEIVRSILDSPTSV